MSKEMIRNRKLVSYVNLRTSVNVKQDASKGQTKSFKVAVHRKDQNAIHKSNVWNLEQNRVNNRYSNSLWTTDVPMTYKQQELPITP